jgi:hypothetical protein
MGGMVDDGAEELDIQPGMKERKKERKKDHTMFATMTMDENSTSANMNAARRTQTRQEKAEDETRRDRDDTYTMMQGMSRRYSLEHSGSAGNIAKIPGDSTQC